MVVLLLRSEPAFIALNTASISIMISILLIMGIVSSSTKSEIGALFADGDIP